MASQKENLVVDSAAGCTEARSGEWFILLAMAVIIAFGIVDHLYLSTKLELEKKSREAAEDRLDLLEKEYELYKDITESHATLIEVIEREAAEH